MFWKIGARVLDLWLDAPLWPKCLNIVSRPQSQKCFFRFEILLNFFSDSEKNEVLVKIGAMVLDLWLDTYFGPKWPKYVV